jgi:hypothetical protein
MPQVEKEMPGCFVPIVPLVLSLFASLVTVSAMKHNLWIKKNKIKKFSLFSSSPHGTSFSIVYLSSPAITNGWMGLNDRCVNFVFFLATTEKKQQQMISTSRMSKTTTKNVRF